MPSISPRTPTLRLAVLAACLLAAALTGLLSSSAHAAEGPQYGAIGQYGEVTRFGGFDKTAYDEDKYDKPLTPGKFLNPVGFTVDPEDTEAGGTAVYVLDRVSDWPETTTLTQGTEWRLQKLSDTGAVLGTTEFYLPKTVAREASFEVSVGLIGLTVNHATGQIYTALYETTGKREGATRYAYEVIGWSTTPKNEKLVAPGASTDSVSTPVAGYSAPGLISSATQLEGTRIYEPAGLALDTTGGKNYVAIEGDSVTRNNESGRVEGPAIVEQVSTESGDETASWSAASLTSSVKNASSRDATAFASGISTDANGNLNVLLSTDQAQLDAVDLSATLTGTPTVLASEAIDTTNEWAHPLLVEAAEEPGDRASAQAVELSNGLYAADYHINSGGNGYWDQSTNEGIRLLNPSAADGLLSNPTLPPTSIFDTLGDATQGSACYLGDEGVSYGGDGVTLAAGAQGTVWILTSGEDSSSSNEPQTQTGRQVIELAPGATSACAKPTGTFTITDTTATTPTPHEASTASPLKISSGDTVEFNASTIDYPTSEADTQAAIYAYEWAPLGTEYTILSDTTSELHPTSTASYQYKTPGVYNVKLKLLGDFGEYDEDGTVIVQTTSPPTAAFTAPATAQTGQPVTFDASGSQPASGATIADYEWKFGDGGTDETQSTTDTHTYTTPGTYTIKLTVRDNDTQESTPATQQITITNPPSTGNEEVSGGGNPGSGSTGSSNTDGDGTLPTTVTPVSPTTTTTPPATTSTTKPKPLTTTQKLANALKQCKKDKTKKQRTSCETQAKKKYTAKPKPKKKSKKIGKKR